MFLRIDKLQVELPAPTRADPNAAAALQELRGGKYREMSTARGPQPPGLRNVRTTCKFIWSESIVAPED
jgi:hypothetical protein